MKIVVAIPAYDRKIGIETVRCLLNEQMVAAANGDDFIVSIVPGTSLITFARNQLVKGFLEGDGERLVFVDADMSWEPGALLKIAHHPVHVCGGAYRLKMGDEAYPVGWMKQTGALPNQAKLDELKLVEVVFLPGGFLAVSRVALERMRAAAPDRAYWYMGQEFHAYFDAPFAQGNLYGEDAAFCHYWRVIGGHVFLDPHLTLTHHDGPVAYRGCAADWLLKQALTAAPAGSSVPEKEI